MTPPRHRAMVVTPPGTGAIAIIRIIGPDPLSVLNNSFVHAQGRLPQPDKKLIYGRLMDGLEMLDDVLVSMEAVAEDGQAIEISCHGGARIVQRILELLERSCAAVDTDRSTALSHWPAHSKIEEEALEAMASARTKRAARYAAHLRSELPQRIRAICQQFETDEPGARASVATLLSGYRAATALLGGVTIALVGPPNSGKSTLFNALIGRQAVVTSPVPGTTRDWVMESVEFRGVPFNLIDTAGRRETDCDLERLAIEAGDPLLRQSHAFLLILDGSVALQESFAKPFRASGRAGWVVANKSDLELQWNEDDLERIKFESGSSPLRVSAQSGAGCELLRETLLSHFELSALSDPPLSFFTHRQAHLADKFLSDHSSPKKILTELLGDTLAATAIKAL